MLLSDYALRSITYNFLGTHPEICPAHAQRPAYYERDDLEDLLYAGNHTLALRGGPHRGKKRRNRKMAIISSLIRILMEPGSPVESEEENEM